MKALISSLWRVLNTPHDIRNVVRWFFHELMNVRAVVLVCRFALLPFNVRRICRCKRIRVVFLPMNVAMWRYGDVYRRMSEDPQFEPIIVTAPRINQPTLSIVRDQQELVDYLKGRGCEIIEGYDAKINSWIDFRALKADVIFYTQPYDGLLPDAFEYWHNLCSLICYAPYSFQFNKVSWNWDNAVQNYAWRHYVSLPHHLDICRKFSRVKARNARPVGYFFEEEYQKACDDRVAVDAVWKNDRRKRVIWAPHHSVEPGASFKTSSFMEIADDMLKLRDRFRDQIVFAFKPHPMLRDNLHQRWGKDATETYYAKWAQGENSFFDDGAFVPLFAGSDAMVHCSGSFIVDYIYTGKPVQYVYCKDRNAPDFGEIGAAALESHYDARSVADIERFLRDVVLGGNDPMKQQREKVYQAYLKSPNGKTFSENVVEDILKGLGKDV